jgi:hypothetical protein
VNEGIRQSAGAGDRDCEWRSCDAVDRIGGVDRMSHDDRRNVSQHQRAHLVGIDALRGIRAESADGNLCGFTRSQRHRRVADAAVLQ